MKRLFVVAMAILFAVACGEKQLTVEEQMLQYQKRVLTALESLDEEEIVAKKGIKSWYDQLDNENKAQVKEMCQEIQAVQKEIVQWTSTLSPEDKEKIKMVGEDVLNEDYFRKMRHVFLLIKITERDEKAESTK